MKAFPNEKFSDAGRQLDTGMDLRDLFAIKAMPEVRWTRTADDLSKSAMDCYAIADAMMKAREQT